MSTLTAVAARHTPGNWSVRGYRTNDVNKNAQPRSFWIDSNAFTKSGKALAGTIAEVYANGTGSNDPQVQEANARLIAAAPDLLSLVKRFVALPAACWHPERHAHEEALLVEEARAAIAKAGG